MSSLRLDANTQPDSLVSSLLSKTSTDDFPASGKSSLSNDQVKTAFPSFRTQYANKKFFEKRAFWFSAIAVSTVGIGLILFKLFSVPRDTDAIGQGIFCGFIALSLALMITAIVVMGPASFFSMAGQLFSGTALSEIFKNAAVITSASLFTTGGMIFLCTLIGAYIYIKKIGYEAKTIDEYRDLTNQILTVINAIPENDRKTCQHSTNEEATKAQNTIKRYQKKLRDIENEEIKKPKKICSNKKEIIRQSNFLTLINQPIPTPEITADDRKNAYIFNPIQNDIRYYIKDYQSTLSKQQFKVLLAYKQLADKRKALKLDTVSGTKKWYWLDCEQAFKELRSYINPSIVSIVDRRPEHSNYIRYGSMILNTLRLNDLKLEKNITLKDLTISDWNLSYPKCTAIKFENVAFDNVEIFDQVTRHSDLRREVSDQRFRPFHKSVIFDKHCTIKLSPNFIDTLPLFQNENTRSQQIDHLFNHINNPQSGSILTAAHAFPDERLRISLIEQIVKQVSNSQFRKDIIQICKEAFVDILMKDQGLYLQKSLIITQFYQDYILDLAKANKSPVKFHPQEIAVILNIFLKNLEKYLFSHNAAMMQVIFYAQTSGNDDLVEKSSTLYQRMIKQEPFASIISANPILFDEGAIDYWFFSSDQKSIIVLDKAYFARNLTTDLSKSDRFFDFYCYQKNSEKNAFEVVIVGQQHEKFLTTFTFINHCFHAINTASMLPKFIKSLGLKPINTDEDDSKDESKEEIFDYEHHFIESTKTKSYQTKLIGDQHDNQLNKLFRRKIIAPYDQPTMNPKAKLTDAFYSNTLKIFNYKDQPDRYKAYLCLSLAFNAFMYSSSKIFGTESASPYILREFGLAFLNKACDLDKSLVPYDTMKNWKGRALGSEFSCTAVLARLIKTHIESIELKGKERIFQVVAPSLWQ